MIASKLAFAAGLFIASSIGGVALGSYTIGGFRADDRPDIIGGLAAADVSSEATPKPVDLAVMDGAHVCAGCDAKLYRDEEWRYQEPAYDEASSESYGEPEDLTVAEDAPQAATAKPETAPVVQIADAGASAPASEAPAQLAVAHSF